MRYLLLAATFLVAAVVGNDCLPGCLYCETGTPATEGWGSIISVPICRACRVGVVDGPRAHTTTPCIFTQDGAKCWAGKECASGRCLGSVCCAESVIDPNCGACASGTGKCSSCKARQLNQTTGYCDPSSTPGSKCVVDADCASGYCADKVCCVPQLGSLCTACSSKTGVCTKCSGGAKLVNGACTAGIPLGSPCKAAGTCTHGDCISGVCACKANQFFDSATSTCQRQVLGGTCNVASDCALTTNINCTAGVCACANNWIGDKCDGCAFGYDINRGCRACLAGRDIATQCTTCLNQFQGENCGVCPPQYNASKQCGACAKNIQVDANRGKPYPDCVDACSGHGMFFQWDSSCICKDDWTGRACDVCPPEIVQGEACDTCKPGLERFDDRPGQYKLATWRAPCVPSCDPMFCNGHETKKWLDLVVPWGPAGFGGKVRSCVCECAAGYHGERCQWCTDPLRTGESNCTQCVSGRKMVNGMCLLECNETVVANTCGPGGLLVAPTTESDQCRCNTAACKPGYTRDPWSKKCLDCADQYRDPSLASGCTRCKAGLEENDQKACVKPGCTCSGQGVATPTATSCNCTCRNLWTKNSDCSSCSAKEANRDDCTCPSRTTYDPSTNACVRVCKCGDYGKSITPIGRFCTCNCQQFVVGESCERCAEGYDDYSSKCTKCATGYVAWMMGGPRPKAVLSQWQSLKSCMSRLCGCFKSDGTDLNYDSYELVSIHGLTSMHYPVKPPKPASGAEVPSAVAPAFAGMVAVAVAVAVLVVAAVLVMRRRRRELQVDDDAAVGIMAHQGSSYGSTA